VRGLDDVCRLRVGFPVSCLEPSDEEGRRSSRPAEVTSLPVRLRAVIGHADLPLAELARLKAGDVIELDGREDGLLSLCIDDAVKFTAMRGRRGGRLAAQIMSRIED